MLAIETEGAGADSALLPCTELLLPCTELVGFAA